MTQVSTSTGLYFPTTLAPVSASGATIDATAEKAAMIGRIYINGRPGTAKTLSTGTIQWRSGSVTFANAGSTLDIGIQDVASGAGPIAQPDGTFDVKATVTSSANTPSANAWQTTTMNSGTKSITHGDLIAVVWDFTARAGADTVSVVTHASIETGGNTGAGLPTTNMNLSAAWQTTASAGVAKIPNAVIVFDDGTIGWIDGSLPCSTVGTPETYADSTNPDERGLIFQLPWDCSVDALWAHCGFTDANSDFTLKLYTTPTTAVSQIASVAVAAENLSVAAGSQMVIVPLAAEVALTKNTEYIVSALATGSTNVRLAVTTLGDAAHRVIRPGGTTLAKGTRNDSTGNFSSASTVIMPHIGVRISSFDDGTGSGAGGGMIRHPGMAGGLNA